MVNKTELDCAVKLWASYFEPTSFLCPILLVGTANMTLGWIFDLFFIFVGLFWTYFSLLAIF